MDINYSKKNNTRLFEDLEKMSLYNLQNYIPSFKLFFKMNEDNNDTINLNITEKLLSVEKQISYNVAESYVSTMNHTKRKKQVFFKYAPIVDPIRYMAGKYKNMKLTLPTYKNIDQTDHYLNKINNEYNSSYIDGLYSYLSSMLHKQGFVNALNFHGIFIGHQKHLKCNIIDDLEFLTESSYFHNNLNNLFDIDKEDIFSISSQDTGGNKEKLKILDTYKNNLCDDELSYVYDSCLTESKLEEITNYDNITDVVHINMDGNSSTCSSASSITDIDDDDDEEEENDYDVINDNETESVTDESSDDCSEISYVESIVHDFPVTVICMEKCDNTLDYLMENELINTNEWISCLMQVIVTLIVYQSIYNFTHNDLHSSNIMYVETKRKYLYYKIEDKVYKVPTYGKIYKIIDFGRSIYSYQNILLYSDAFDKKEDAATQYNFGPFRDEEKPEILPNKSFDLSRLACSLYDYFDDYEKKTSKDKNLYSLISGWCKDDNGKNILYKSSGEERYPEFKLYKMIARTVHKCVPLEQLRNQLFSNYITIVYDESNVMDISSYVK
jgi:hypothetical protein